MRDASRSVALQHLDTKIAVHRWIDAPHLYYILSKYQTCTSEEKKYGTRKIASSLCTHRMVEPIMSSQYCVTSAPEQCLTLLAVS